MPKITRNFTKGRMNKMFDERLVPNGEYVNALNIRMGSTEGSEIGVLENSKGNDALTDIRYNGSVISSAKCIGAFEDGANETLYWFIHADDEIGLSPDTGKIDMVLSYNTKSNLTTYHVISINDGDDVNTTLNFNPNYLITGVNLIDGLLFWTDNYSAPKKINVNRNYGNPVSGDDGFTLEDILVIKAPPITSPTIVPYINTTEENFLEDRFICFGYRYGYGDNEHSATSQFSAPTFVPNVFDYDPATTLNEGMLNTTNACRISFNTGSSLVKSIDLLFKDMNDSIIKVIESLDKKKKGYADNTVVEYNFTNSKIFTVLPEAEILRMYDNVPKLAQAQTLMGNRLMYGNYTEGGDLIDLNGQPTLIEYETQLVSNEIGFEELDTVITSAVYSYSPDTSDGTFSFDLDGLDLVAGATLSFDIRFEFGGYGPSSPITPTSTQQDTEISFTYVLPRNFTSANDLATDADFIAKIKGITPYPSVQNSCSETSLTDIFNCAIDNSLTAANPPLNSVIKYDTFIDSLGDRISIFQIPNINSTLIYFSFPGIVYVDDLVSLNEESYAVYDIISADVTYREVGNPKSLHSNRGYEIGQIYMDEFNRASTALVSENNTVHVSCGLSPLQNSIRVVIPTQQIAPSWATRYKFAIKPDKKDYDVIYSNFFFRDPTSGADFFLLDGQNSQKVEVGDELIVKRDTDGPLGRCVTTTVLEKEAQAKGFLDPKPIDSEGNDIEVPSGVYMKLRANNFSTSVGELPIVAYGTQTNIADNGNCPAINYAVDYEDPANPGQYIDYTIPAGSRINIVIKNNREGVRNVSEIRWNVDANFTASKEYANFKDWWEGDNVANALESQATDVGPCTGPNYEATYGSSASRDCSDGDVRTNFYITGSGATQRTYLMVKGTKGKGTTSPKKETVLSVDITVVRSNGVLIFETEPTDAAPDLWYESDESFAIDENGYHAGNVQNQDATNNAIIDTSFFNCYTFGNGAESYKIQDSIVGKEVTLGNRATSTQEENYKESTRFPDITYSGIYNEETNINKLNEFNKGLLNFKPLEASFGPLQKLFARETDVLAIQEDKISYVLAGKNLLSDSAGGSTLTSVPEVLGTQVARVENFGISANPESFAQWGPDKYFTDAKRGVVLMLSGNGPSESLNVISEQGMEPYFRNLFISSFDTQKLGGFDPYMKEYVLSSNDTTTPVIEDCISCGTTQTFKTEVSKYITFCVDYGNLVGNVDIDYNIISMNGEIGLAANWDGGGASTSIGTLDPQSGTLSFNKSKVSVETGTIELDIDGAAEIELTYNCPDADAMTVILVHLTSGNEEGLFTTDQYRWTDGSFVSPLHSESITFGSGASPVVSMYKTIAGEQGGGVIPADFAEVTMIANKLATDNFVFDSSTDTFKYLRSNTVYANNPTDIQSLLAASSTATPIVDPILGSNAYTAEFTMPASGGILYLIWDYRNSTEADLCFGATIDDACCGCL